MKKLLLLLTALVLLLACGHALADVYTYQDEFGLLYPSGWTVTEAADAQAQRCALTFSGEAQGRPTVEVYAAYEEGPRWFSPDATTISSAQQLMDAYASLSPEYLFTQSKSSRDMAIWRGTAESGPVLAASVPAPSYGGWTFTFILRAWADEARTAYRLPGDADYAQLCFFLDNLYDANTISRLTTVGSFTVGKPFHVVTYTAADGTQVPFGLPGAFADEAYTKAYTNGNGQNVIEAYEDTEKRYLLQTLLFTTDENGLPRMSLYDAKYVKDADISYDADRRVWLLVGEAINAQGYLNDAGVWVQDAYYGEELRSRTWYEGDARFVADYENGELISTTATTPDREDRYNADGMLISSKYYNEKGFTVTDSYRNGVLSTRSYNDDTGMRVEESYDSGTLEKITHTYTALDGTQVTETLSPDGQRAIEEVASQTIVRQEGNAKITEYYDEAGVLLERHTLVSEFAKARTVLTIDAFEADGSIRQREVQLRPISGGPATSMTRTHQDESGQWVTETYDGQGQLTKVEPASQPE